MRPRLSGKRLKAFKRLIKDERRILVIGDVHAPYTKKGYREFCQKVYAEHNCNQVIYIGDICDHQYSSFHDSNPDLSGGKDELEYAIAEVHKWRDAFPSAKSTDCIVGNHDRIIARKMFKAGIPSQWLKSYNEVLGTDWNWTERIVYDDVQYLHGEGGTASTKAKNDMMSTVQGHIHTQCYVQWHSGQKRVLSMQVGSGVDRDSIGMSYAKAYKFQQLACGIVIGGHTAFNVMMPI
jgi:predicted phosphodiesterase